MHLHLNGMTFEVEEGMTLPGLLDWAGHEDLRGLAVAIDDEVVPRSEWDSTVLSPGQRVEIVRAVGGGRR